MTPHEIFTAVWIISVIVLACFFVFYFILYVSGLLYDKKIVGQSILGTQPIQESIAWDMSREEQRRNKLRGIIWWFPKIFVGILVPLQLKYVFEQGTFEPISFLGLIVIFVISYYLTLKMRYSNVSYRMDKNGICIIRDGIKKEHLWTDFEFFYRSDFDVTEYAPNSTASGESEERGAKWGQRLFFLLKKKPNRLFSFRRSIVVVQTEPENRKEVWNFTRCFLQERMWDNAHFVKFVD